MKRERETRERPAYEERYDAADRTISFAGADEIERASWDNARLLVPEDEAPEPEPTLAPAPTPAIPEPAGENGEDIGLSPEQKAFLAALVAGDGTALSAALAGAGVTLDRMVESVNELASERFGDILIEPSEDGYAVIGDYTEEVLRWTERR